METQDQNQTFPRTPVILILLTLGTLLLFSPVGKFDFVGYDDPYYVTENPRVQAGLTAEGLKWAFFELNSPATYWHPISWVSHMVDCQLFGLKASAHHWMNVFYHIANALLVFFLLRKLTGSEWRSAAVAALFAWHPLQVESVAWVTERKNLISTLFFLLTLIAYARFAERLKTRGVADESPLQALKSRLASGDYWLVVVLFALGLMSKPMLVTVPCVLLLLDFWPLRRVEGFQGAGARRAWVTLAVEKLPLLALSGISSWITIAGHHQLQYVVSGGQVPLGIRIANALYSYARYIGSTLWPTDLAAIYPYPTSWPISRVVMCLLLIGGLTVLFVWIGRRRPVFLVGWLWFLGTLVPVIGILQVGGQSIADRFMYIPLIGLLLIVVWGVGALMEKIGAPRMVAGVLAGIVGVAAIGASRHQVKFWKDSQALFERALAVTEKNAIAHYNLGLALSLQGRATEAKLHYQKALEIAPAYTEARNNLAGAYYGEGNMDEAERHYREVLKVSPRHPLANENLAFVLEQKGNPQEALQYVLVSLKEQPSNMDTRFHLLALYGKLGRGNEAVAQAQEIERLRPNDPGLFFALGNAMLMQEKTSEAMAYFTKAIQLRPAFPEAHYQLGNILALSGKVPQALPHFAEVVRLDPKAAEPYVPYAMALAEVGRIDEAVEKLREALQIKPELLPALQRLGWFMAAHKEDRIRNGLHAVQYANTAVTLTREQDADSLDLLAAAFAEQGKFNRAIEEATKAIRVAKENNLAEYADQIQARLELYRQDKPYRMP